ncbi:porin [Azospirillum agricola]|uniref:porin n=1 Tax=Azospirillum agricola TaxID=1720247 RepID=UPI000A0F265F|nr:porin [Azospirillum agricola]SMH62117.1 porin [Azospirillum lipoferum]
MKRPFLARLLALVVSFPAVSASADVVYNRSLDPDAKPVLQVGGGWGQLELGQTEGARRRLAALGSIMASGPGDESARLTYYTPPVRGFEVGASYTPMPRGTEALPDPRDARHMVEAAIRKKTRIGKATVRLTAGTSRARVRADSRRVPRQSWMAGAQVGWEAVRLDSDLRQQVTADGAASRVWNTALAYGAGNVTLSLNLRRSWVEGEPVAGLYRADAAYQLTPRWQLVADTDIAAAGGSPEAVVTVGTRLLF